MKTINRLSVFLCENLCEDEEASMSKNKIYDDFLELCSVPSVSGTEGELKMAAKIYEVLNRIDYFQRRPEQLQICPVPEDKLKRSFVYALMEGQIPSPQTIILLSHFDVVAIDGLVNQDKLEFAPAAYTEFLLNNPQIMLNEEARKDLESGDYLFGCGTLDMKFGIAADIEILRKTEQELENFAGNILFVSVPDEETNSAGMLAAVDFLLSLKKEKQLEYTCCLVSEPSFPKYPGDKRKYLYTGTVGKMLPVFYCVGRVTHVCEPFAGLNPNRLTSRIIEKIDCNPELSDSINGVFTPAPVCLKQADTKTTYTAQTSTASYTYFNFMTLSKTPQEVMQDLLAVAGEAFLEVLDDRKKNAAKLSGISGNIPEVPDIEPKVITFQELYVLCYEAHEEDFASHIREFINHYGRDGERGQGDLRDFSIEIVKEIHKFCPYREPMIVVFYAPPFYPHSEVQPLNSKVGEVSRHIAGFAKQFWAEELQVEPFFPGVSDMSYLGLSNKVDIEELINNFPVWNSGYRIPLKTIAELNIPFINIGPLGKDAHQYTERICLSYSFAKVAPLIWEAVKRLLDHKR